MKYAYFFLFVIYLLHYCCNNGVSAVDCGLDPEFCDASTDLFRTFTGECNNPNNPSFGTHRSTYGRLMKPRYSDGISAPPKAISGNELPNAQKVRAICLKDDLLLRKERDINVFVSSWLQQTCHDMGFVRQKVDVDPLSCCTPDMQSLSATPSYCFNIIVDPQYSKTSCEMTCIPVVKSLTNYDVPCEVTTPRGPAQQINAQSSYIDLDPVYGRNKRRSDSLRVMHGGLLQTQTSNGYTYPPDDPTKRTCPFIPTGSTETCFRGGDERMNQNPDLTQQAVILLRIHNIIAEELEDINCCWSDERLFQETRKIVIGVFQWLTYFEVLPRLLGKANMYKYGLLSFYDAFYYIYRNDYDPTCELKSYQEFSHGAFRGVHTLINGRIGLYNRFRQEVSSVQLHEHNLHSSQVVMDNFDPLLIGQATAEAHQFGNEFDPEVTTRLFERVENCGIDLPALDIQRSRDHGMSSYNDMREYCDLPRAQTFEDFGDEMDAEDIANIASVFEHPDDVDLLVGLLNENNMDGAEVGPTTACIIAKQFKDARECDRFYFDHPQAGFTPSQLAEIRKTTVAWLLCETGNDIDSMQPWATMPPDWLNFPIDCRLIYKLNLHYWKDLSCIFC